MMEQLRLYSGVVLLIFVLMHFLEHTLGIFSIPVANHGGEFLTELWDPPPASLLLILALLLHPTLALWTLVRRRNFRMPHWQLWQMGLGILIPLFLLDHLLANLVLSRTSSYHATREFVLTAVWKMEPGQGIKLGIGFTLVWIHAVLGFRQWQGHQSWFNRWRTSLLVLAFLIPSLTLAGYIAAGVRSPHPDQQPHVVQKIMDEARFTPKMAAWVHEYGEGLTMGYLGLLLLLLLIRKIRLHILMQGTAPKLFYRDNFILNIPSGASVLEVIQSEGISHASICGGRGRCSVCRVRVGQGGEHLPPPNPVERHVLQRVGAPDSIRLACQIRPSINLEVTPQLPPSATIHDGLPDSGHKFGRESEIAILFADLRGFTTMAENRLPFDVVFILNQYFKLMGKSVEASGGYLDKFIGDGVMALFGIESDMATGCRAAVQCAQRVDAGLAMLNEQLQHELDMPLRVGIGIHAGHVILGEMGYGTTRHLTALGDTVNTASRLEGVTKELGVQLVISDLVAQQAHISPEPSQISEISIRGRTEPLVVHAIPSASSLFFVDE
ncbi:MAG: adenylate/guanylate cyclase domain-containing protein [Magnetococcales bacterium]|nr:adenylate/guanylate cyclase domain-containing protein [Magnetococcales bacterium]MBF0321653.1 adenylate/guanylate cyclase domain-containing protein [Magnetococcales bacterium]